MVVAEGRLQLRLRKSDDFEERGAIEVRKHEVGAFEVVASGTRTTADDSL